MREDETCDGMETRKNLKVFSWIYEVDRQFYVESGAIYHKRYNLDKVNSKPRLIFQQNFNLLLIALPRNYPGKKDFYSLSF